MFASSKQPAAGVTEPSVAQPPTWERSAAWAVTDGPKPVKDETSTAITPNTAAGFSTGAPPGIDAPRPPRHARQRAMVSANLASILPQPILVCVPNGHRVRTYGDHVEFALQSRCNRQLAGDGSWVRTDATGVQPRSITSQDEIFSSGSKRSSRQGLALLLYPNDSQKPGWSSARNSTPRSHFTLFQA